MLKPLPACHLALLLLFSASALDAQFDSTTVVGRAVQRRMVRMEHNPDLASFFQAGGFTNPSDPWGTGPVDDATVALMLQLFVQALDQHERAICHALVTTGNGDFISAFLASVEDSLVAERWADMIEQGAWSTNGLRDPGRKWPVASTDDVRARMSALLNGDLSPADQQIVKRSRETGDTGDVPCLLLRLLFRQLATEPTAVAGAVMRGMYTMGSK
jgi:hypothetical protein